MDSISALREQLGSAHWFLEETMNGVTPEVFRWDAPGMAESIADNYLHTVVGEDQTIHGMLQNKSPLLATSWTGKTGLSSVPEGAHGSDDWSTWIKSVEVDLPKFREYAKAVHAAADAYLASLKPEDLVRSVDLAGFGLGVQSTNWAIYNFVIGHAAQHNGEISVLKGCQDLRGYPY